MIDAPCRNLEISKSIFSGLTRHRDDSLPITMDGMHKLKTKHWAWFNAEHVMSTWGKDAECSELKIGSRSSSVPSISEQAKLEQAIMDKLSG